ncbi:hypothetical protein [uncultured Clostridium sp.]|uniref:hypothetical protein n=1 Tax=uncultured Clostridium sp. TaxID=59620 RepID=UPI0025FA8837|nr:hypothetical protein [uncultured Clostridium sp.]
MKRIGTIVYDDEKDCCMVRYNGDIFMEIPERAELYVLHGNVWLRSQLRRSVWGYWVLTDTGTTNLTGVCVMIDIDGDGKYRPKIIKDLWERWRRK